VTGGGETRAPYDELVSLYLPIAAVVFALVALTLVVVAIRFRARPGRAPSARQSAPRLEIAYAVALAAVAVLLLWRSFGAMSDSDTVVARAAPAAGGGGGAGELTIGVVASRWNWRLTYPGGVVQSGDGRTRPARLVVPARRPVRFRLTSRDVVHSLWVPELRAKYDAMPGYTNIFDLRFLPGGDYSTVRCSEFCGDLHDQMLLHIDVRAPLAFDAWLRGRQRELRR
jgi:cytochrome c oxidase subunit 2